MNNERFLNMLETTTSTIRCKIEMAKISKGSPSQVNLGLIREFKTSMKFLIHFIEETHGDEYIGIMLKSYEKTVSIEMSTMETTNLIKFIETRLQQIDEEINEVLK